MADRIIFSQTKSLRTLVSSRLPTRQRPLSLAPNFCLYLCWILIDFSSLANYAESEKFAVSVFDSRFTVHYHDSLFIHYGCSTCNNVLSSKLWKDRISATTPDRVIVATQKWPQYPSLYSCSMHIRRLNAIVLTPLAKTDFFQRPS